MPRRIPKSKGMGVIIIFYSTIHLRSAAIYQITKSRMMGLPSGAEKFSTLRMPM
jgi:hypothetical protein